MQQGKELVLKSLNMYADTVLRIAYQNLKNMSDSEDVMQEVFIKLMQTDISFTCDEHIKAWLIRVTINKCKDYKKSAWYKKTESIDNFENLSIFTSEDNDVLEEINKLPVKYRNVIYLYYYEEYTIQEIANLLGKSINTISSQLQRARKLLKIRIEEEYESENRYISCNN